MARGKIAAKVGRAACPHAAEGGVLAAKNAKSAKAGRAACPHAAEGGVLATKTSLTGLTRFTGFKEGANDHVNPLKTKLSGVEWLGDIPEGWEVVPIRYYIDSSFSGVWGSEANVEQRTITCYRIADFDYARGTLKHGPLTARSYSELEIEGKLVSYGDLLLEKSGGGDASPVGRVIFVDRCDCATCSNFIQQMRCKALGVGKYLYYIFHALYSRQVNGLYYNQTIGIQNLKVPKYLSVKVPLPPLPEQRAIADYLDEKCGAIDAAIAEAKKGIEEYKAWKKSLIFEAVTGKRRVGAFNARTQRRRGRREAEKMKPSGIPWIGTIPEGWKVSRVKNECDCLDYLREPISAENRVNEKALYDYYGASGAIDKIDDFNVDDTVLLIGEDGANLRMRNLPLVYRASGKIWVNNHAHILKVKPSNDYGFMAYALEAGDYNDFVTGSAQPKLTQTDLMAMPVVLPSLPEQQAIADYLDKKCAAIDAMVTEKEALIADLEAYKKSLIYETVTGKREVA